MSAASLGREHATGAKPPPVRALRLVGPGADKARGRLHAPLGATFDPGAEAYAVVLGPADAVSVATVARALPDPGELPDGTLLVVFPQVLDAPSLVSRLFAALGRGHTVSRVLRSSALVARGYVRVAAGVDRESRSDLVWGYSLRERPIAERDINRDLTERD